MLRIDANTFVYVGLPRYILTDSDGPRKLSQGRFGTGGQPLSLIFRFGVCCLCGLTFTQQKGIIAMSKKTNKSNQDKIAAKKAAVLGTAKKSRMPLFVGLFGAVFIAVAVMIYLNLGDGDPSAIASAPATADGTSVSFSASLFEDGQARRSRQPIGDRIRRGRQ